MSEQGAGGIEFKESAGRQTGIGETFVAKLKQSGAMIETPDFEKVGVEAIGGTNETGDPNLFEKVRNQPQAPNGYLIGVGAANVFSMLEAFPEGVEPRAIILFDIDPEVVAAGERMIQAFRTTLADPSIKLDYGERIFDPSYPAYYQNALKKYASLLHKLAAEGNLVIARAEFNNPDFIHHIAQLPDFQNLNNVIYLSNIADHSLRREEDKNPLFIPNLDILNILQLDTPHRNYYIDTLQHGLAYRLRISTYPPRFSARDFNPLANMTQFQTELTDQIDGPNENIIWEDLSTWPLDRLIHFYNQITNTPTAQERKEYIESAIRKERSGTIEHYDEFKEKSTQPPEEIYPGAGRFKTYVVPDNPEEETRLLQELAKAYDYERDFLPFVPEGYWQDAVTPQRVNPYQIPKTPRPVFATWEEYDEYRKYGLYRFNPRNNKKGEIEKKYMDSKITYEDLALAKLYREMKRRVLKRRAAARTQSKNFHELSKEAIAPY
ncbi:MAG: hypothetical protein G01um10147_497 [Microgenomates group bacterium Gr01-1014_7]|nr:MAG: hypothetical protein G01um10147_497 [Microgenomates group bacterium Gr01-1014_7]